MLNMPSASPKSIAATGFALPGRTSNSATKRSPSSGTLTNTPGVKRLNSSGASRARRTSKQASVVEDPGCDRTGAGQANVSSSVWAPVST